MPEEEACGEGSTQGTLIAANPQAAALPTGPKRCCTWRRPSCQTCSGRRAGALRADALRTTFRASTRATRSGTAFNCCCSNRTKIFTTTPSPVGRSETAEEACISSNVICEHCKCPLKKLFQHGCDQKSCVVRRARQRIDQVCHGAPRPPGTILMVGVYWQFYFDKSPETICWFKLLSLFVMAGGSFRVSGFLALRVDDPFPRPWIGYIGVEFHNKFIKDSPGEEYVTRAHQYRYLIFWGLRLSIYVLLNEAPFAPPTWIPACIALLSWCACAAQYFAKYSITL